MGFSGLQEKCGGPPAECGGPVERGELLAAKTCGTPQWLRNLYWWPGPGECVVKAGGWGLSGGSLHLGHGGS